MDKKWNKWVELIKDINQKNLIAIICYADTNLLVLLEEINFNNLLENSGLVKKIQKKGIIPLYLTREYINTSSDVYPLEYLKMKTNPVILYGKNILEDLVIPAENIRLESEQKVKGALIRITQVILEEGNNKKKLSRTAFLALEDLLMGMTGMLKIANISASSSPQSLISQAQQQFNLDLGPFIEIANWKTGTKPPDYKKLIYDFYEKIEELACKIDTMDISE